MGKAHDILIDFDNAAWHCPGPGQCFGRDPRTAQLAGALFVEVISAPNSHQDLRNRINRARLLERLPWVFEANCQHTIKLGHHGTATEMGAHRWVAAWIAIE